MNITYVKILHGIEHAKERVKDPIYDWSKEIFPNDNLNCAVVPDRYSRPEIMIGRCDTAEVILRNAHRYYILINPSLSKDDGGSLRHDVQNTARILASDHELNGL